MIKNGWTIDLYAPLAVIGTNPEMADVNNPRGEILGAVYYFYAENERGDTFVGPKLNTLNQEKALAILEASVKRFPADFDPAAYDWQPHGPRYGSVAYWQAEPDLVATEKQEALDREGYSW